MSFAASANSALNNESGATIPTVADGTSVIAGTKGYGWGYSSGNGQLGGGIGSRGATYGSLTQTKLTPCTLNTLNCGFGPANTPQEIFNSGDAAIEGGRAGLAIGAGIDGTAPAGIYSDVLTFLATGTF